MPVNGEIGLIRESNKGKEHGNTGKQENHFKVSQLILERNDYSVSLSEKSGECKAQWVVIQQQISSFKKELEEHRDFYLKKEAVVRQTTIQTIRTQYEERSKQLQKECEEQIQNNNSKHSIEKAFLMEDVQRLEKLRTEQQYELTSNTIS